MPREIISKMRTSPRLPLPLFLLVLGGCGGASAPSGSDMTAMSASDLAAPPDFAAPRDLAARSDLIPGGDLGSSGDMGGDMGGGMDGDMGPSGDMAGACDPMFDGCGLQGAFVCDAATRMCVPAKPCTMDSECGSYRCGNIAGGAMSCFASCGFGGNLACAAPATCNSQTFVCAP